MTTKHKQSVPGQPDRRTQQLEDLGAASLAGQLQQAQAAERHEYEVSNKQFAILVEQARRAVRQVHPEARFFTYSRDTDLHDEFFEPYLYLSISALLDDDGKPLTEYVEDEDWAYECPTEDALRSDDGMYDRLSKAIEQRIGAVEMNEQGVIDLRTTSERGGTALSLTGCVPDVPDDLHRQMAVMDDDTLIKTRADARHIQEQAESNFWAAEARYKALDAECGRRSNLNTGD